MGSGLPAMHGAAQYRGVERRRHTVLVTDKSEYHCRDGWCLAVRSRATGRFVSGHPAIGLRVTYGVRYGHGRIDRVTTPGDLFPGDRICLSTNRVGRENEIITSPLVAIVRPPKYIVAGYGSGPSS